MKNMKRDVVYFRIVDRTKPRESIFVKIGQMIPTFLYVSGAMLVCFGPGYITGLTFVQWGGVIAFLFLATVFLWALHYVYVGTRVTPDEARKQIDKIEKEYRKRQETVCGEGQ